jgi:hypothetical protein
MRMNPPEPHQKHQTMNRFMVPHFLSMKVPTGVLTPQGSDTCVWTLMLLLNAGVVSCHIPSRP